jgi:Spy/CpxP family protein refolding chaperone
MEDQKMKPTHKKLVGGLLIAMLIATVGAAFATATGQTDGTTDDLTDDAAPQMPFRGRHEMNRLGPFASELTDAQKTELKELMTTLRNQNATPEEIRTAIQEKLGEFGVLDTRLDTEITQTQQRLTILNRQKELRNEGYSWDEIRTIIQDEFNLQNTTGVNQDMMFDHGFERGPCGGLPDFNSSEEPDQ